MASRGKSRAWVERLAAHPAFRALARAGFVARAFLYGVVGLVALASALGLRNRSPIDAKGAIAVLSRHAPTRGLAAILGVALAGLALWFAVDAVVDPARRRGPAGAVLRAGQGAGSLGYVALSLFALQIALGGGLGPSGDQLVRWWTARLLAASPGRPAVATAGAIVVVVGARQAWYGVRRAFAANLHLRAMPAGLRPWALRLGTLGFATQGLLFAATGALLLRAAVRESPWGTGGFARVLRDVAASPAGRVGLAAAAAGLVAYAGFAAVEGTWRKLRARG